MIDLTSPEWMSQLVEASNQTDTSLFTDETVVVSLAIGKKACVFTLSGGRVIEASVDAEPDVTIPVTNKQLAALIDGSVQLSSAYMQGDIKPVGSSRALLHAVELFDNTAVQTSLAQQLAD